MDRSPYDSMEEALRDVKLGFIPSVPKQVGCRIFILPESEFPHQGGMPLPLG